MRLKQCYQKDIIYMPAAVGGVDAFITEKEWVDGMCSPAEGGCRGPRVLLIKIQNWPSGDVTE